MKKLASMAILLILLLLVNTAASENSFLPAGADRSLDRQCLYEEKPRREIPGENKEEGSCTGVNESGNAAGKPEYESIAEKIDNPPAAENLQAATAPSPKGAVPPAVNSPDTQSQASQSQASQSQTSVSNTPPAGSASEKAALKMEDVLFFGDSITEGLAIYKFFPMAVHMGINSLSVSAAIGHVDDISAHNPKEIFILLGTNDLWGQVPEDTFASSYANLLKALKGKCPASKIFVQSVFPVGESAMARNPLIDNGIIDGANEKLKAVAAEYGCIYIDINSLLKDENNNLCAEYTIDGVHILAQYYHIWTDAISGFIPSGA